MGIFTTASVEQKDLTTHDLRMRDLGTQIIFDPVVDYKAGYRDENLAASGIKRAMVGPFEAEPGYNVFEDPNLYMFQNDMTAFITSRSSSESSYISDRLREHMQSDYRSPYYWLGRVSGFLTDPTSLLLFTKLGRGMFTAAKFGTAVTVEEVAKQWLDPAREDEFVPWTIGLGYGLPAIINKFKSPIPPAARGNFKKADETFFSPEALLTEKGYEEGKLIDPNKVTPPSTAGSRVNPDAPKHLSYNAEKRSEEIVRTHLSVFGEDGPWTPVFRVLKATSLKARQMVTELFNTPLLQKKNLKEFEHKASTMSAEIERKLMEREPVEAHKAIRDLYSKYLVRLKQRVPISEVGMSFANQLNKNVMSLSEFATEVTRARLNNLRHDIQEVSEAARVTQEKLFGPFLELMNKYKLRLDPLERELNFWESVAHRMVRKGETETVFQAQKATLISGQDEFATWHIKQINARIKKLKDAIRSAEAGTGVKNFIPLIYVRTAIEKNRVLFKQLLKEDFMRNNKHGLLTRLDEIVEDLTHSFPFVRMEKALANEAERFAFTRPTFARSSRIREIAPDEITQLKLIDNGFVVSDMFYLLKSYYRQISADIVLAKRYGDANALGWRTAAGEAGWMDGLIQIRSEYATRIRTLMAPMVKIVTKMPSGTTRLAWFTKNSSGGGTVFINKAAIKSGFVNKPWTKPTVPGVNPLPANQFKNVKEWEDFIYYHELSHWKNLRLKGESLAQYENRINKLALDLDNRKLLEEAILKDTTLSSKLIKEKNQILGDLEAMVEMIRGTYGLPGDPTRWWSRGMRMFKHYNALTMLTGFFAALPDVARNIHVTGWRRAFPQLIEAYSEGINGRILMMGKHETQAAAEALDMITGHRAMLFSDIKDMYAITSRAESLVGKASHFNFMYVNLMSRWTEFMKTFGGTIIGSRILEDSIKWSKGTLSTKWKTTLASSGIDQAMSARIVAQYEKHGTKGKKILIAQTDLWDDTVAKQHYRAAMNMEVNRTIVTPELGDTPLWMSTELGSTIAQFKKFVMAAHHRMLMRGLQEMDEDFMAGVILLMGSGMMIDALYTYSRFQKDWGKKPIGEKILAAFDRSGLGGIYVDINRSIESLSDNRIGIRPLIGSNRPYSNSMKSKVGNVLGPTGGQIANIFDIFYDVGTGQYNHWTARNVRRLIPLQNIFYLDYLFDDIEKGLR